MNTIELDELKRKLERNEITLVEVLNEDEYNKAHIKGAINLPLEKINEDVRSQFLKQEPIIFYCTNSDCTAGRSAAEKFEGYGFENVSFFPGGKMLWEKAGLPMVRSGL
jgi:rhodanese-related sulfurtransferase